MDKENVQTLQTVSICLGNRTLLGTSCCEATALLHFNVMFYSCRDAQFVWPACFWSMGWNTELTQTDTAKTRHLNSAQEVLNLPGNRSWDFLLWCNSTDWLVQSTLELVHRKYICNTERDLITRSATCRYCASAKLLQINNLTTHLR